MVMGSDKPQNLMTFPLPSLPKPMFSTIVAKVLYEIALDLSWRHTPNGVGVSSASFVRGAPSDRR